MKGKKISKTPKKTAGFNQWISTHLKSRPDKRDRRDGPGGD